MDFQVLGPLEVLDGGRQVAIRGGKQRALLCALLVHRGQVVTTDRLADSLWGDDLPGNPANALQAQVSHLRQALGGNGVVVTRGPGYALDVPADHVDASRFEQLAARGRRLLDDGDPRAAAGALGEALGLWRGPAFADFAHEEFARSEAVRLDELKNATLEAHVDARLALGRHAELVGELEVLTAENPLRERLWGQRMIALYRCGRQADAIRAYAEARGLLVEELGIEPGPDLRAVESMVLNQDPRLDPPEAPAPDAVARPQTNLRAQLTRFVGRGAELERLTDTVRGARLVTLVGPGGAGKTRLATEVATGLVAELADGAWLVELGPVGDPAGVGPAVAAVLGSDERRPTGAADVIDDVARELRGRSLLVVLDNCEHVVAEAARVVDALAGACPGLRVLATSREGLGVPGEVLIPVAPLPLDDAVALFADRAKAAQPAFALDDASRPVVDEICSRLDGLPLAVELAAARVRALPVEQIASRLGDRFRLLTGGSRTALPRQQTLRAVVDWSYDLLFEDERRLFERLSVFAGGCELDAAEQVCAGGSIESVDVMELLARLIDKSLVVVSGGRYHLLETLAQYAREKLAASGEADEYRRRHAHFFRAFAEECRPLLRGSTAVAGRRRVRTDLENVRAALDWYRGEVDAEGALTVAVAVAWCWFSSGEYAEAARWCEEAMAVPGGPATLRAEASTWYHYYASAIEPARHHVDGALAAVEVLRTTGPSQALADAWLASSAAAFRASDYELMEELLTQGWEVAEEIDSDWSRGVVYLLRSVCCTRTGRLDEAEEAVRRSLDTFRSAGDETMVAELLGVVAEVAEHRGDVDEAAVLHTERLELAVRLELPMYEVWATTSLGVIRIRLGDPAGGEELLVRALRRNMTPLMTAMALDGRGAAARQLGDVERARRHYAESLANFEIRSYRPGEASALRGLGWCAFDGGDADAAGARFSESLERALLSAEERPVARALEGLAATAVLRDEGATAARLLGAADAIRRRAGCPLPSDEEQDVVPVEERTRHLAGDAAFADAFSSGLDDPDAVVTSLSPVVVPA